MTAHAEPRLESNHLHGLEGLNTPVTIARDVVLLPGYANLTALIPAIEKITLQAPWRHMQVPRGRTMSVAMSNCGKLGWVSDASGYRYTHTDPLRDSPWPQMPPTFAQLAKDCAASAGFGQGLDSAGFVPDACLINGYREQAKLSLHRDANEADFTQPIVSVSLGATARFVIGGAGRSDPTTSVLLHHGDVLVWGRTARLMHHGVGVPRTKQHAGPSLAMIGPFSRINLTFRRAG